MGSPLISSDKNNFTASGPVFEFGPGWGAKTRIWLKRYFLKAVIPAAVLLVVLILLTRGLDRLSENVQLTATPDLDKSSVILAVARGDSWSLLARRAIAGYIEQSPDKKFSPGQKLFAEEKLRIQLAAENNLKIGQQISVPSGKIQSALDKSLSLNKYALAVWDNYAREAGIK